MSGLSAMIWKEWRCILARRNRLQLILPLLTVAFLPIWSGIEMGRDLLDDPVLPTIVVLVTPMLVLGILVPDAFAGERERRTLATLLAAPLSDRAILVGKLVVPILLNLGMIALMLSTSVLVANLADPGPGLQLFPPAMMLGLPLLGLLTGVLVAALGVFVSLRSSTVQTAQQVLVSALMLPLMIGGAIFMAFATRGGPPPAWLTDPDMGVFLVAISGVLAIIDTVLLALVVVRFNRARLIGLG